MNKKNLISSLVLLAFFTQAGISQYIPNDNFHQLNPFSFNPAAAGLRGNVTAFLNYRDQWSGLKGAPETVSFGMHGLVTSAMGLGLNIGQTNIGIFKQFSADMSYSYRISIDERSQSLSFGLNFGFSQNKINHDEVQIDDNSDPTLYSSEILDETLVRTGFGMHYNWEDLNIHLSSPILYGSQEKVFPQTLFGFASYDYLLPGDIWKIQPSALYRYTADKTNQFEMNVLAEWHNRVWVSAGYRTNKSILTGFGISLKGLGIGYAYEINRSELSSVSSGSHQLILFFESSYSVTRKTPLYRSSKQRSSWR
ncbi:MAG TPA: type IX secretion system membrane protein PorP/SprF [Bacteroides sp.]|nr:type IX secretion system membrane protein PorP/SprF [Bacteroides sp.]